MEVIAERGKSIEATDASRLAASKARQSMPFDIMLSTLLSSLFVSLTASASTQLTSSALQAFSAALCSAAT